MTTEIVSVSRLTPFKELAAVLSHRRINAVPALDSDDGVVIPLPVGSMLAASIEEAVVGFQADLLDERTLQGWTVPVIGRSHRISDPARLADLQRHGPRPWGHRAAESYLRIDPELVMGTRLGF